jgi:hypothetical protein
MHPAQFQNEDGIKISISTVETAITHTKCTASESTLHRITPAIVQNRTLLQIDWQYAVIAPWR